MADTWGNRIKLTLFGESHGPAVGVVIDGLPPGEEIDLAKTAREMERRAPGRDAFSTPRRETDRVEILSGLYEGKTTGSALCGIIRNENTRSSDYNSILRPGHADWTALMKYGGYADMRGGGHFSGRLTAPLTFAGAVVRQILFRRGVRIYGRITAIGGMEDTSVPPDEKAYRSIGDKAFPVLDDEVGAAMQACILQARQEKDSVGGILEVAAFGVPGGWGDPFFRSVESIAASLFFSIPAVKGVEFGDGFGLVALKGSQANDPLYLEDGVIRAGSNHSGGVQGGITTGEPLLSRLAIKPTPSIGKAQRSVDAAAMTESILEIEGRHDPCILPRALVVAESALALSILDCMPEGTEDKEEANL